MSEKSKDKSQSSLEAPEQSIQHQFFSQISSNIMNSSNPSSDPWAFNQEQFFEMVAFDQEDGTLCCCKENLSHDESLKFMVKASPEDLKLAPFAQLRKGKVRDNWGAVRNTLSFT